MPTRRTLLLSALSVTLLPPMAAAQAVLADDGIALSGYDPVAYFTEGRPVPGLPAHAADWSGATWHFASDANRAAFLAEPERYAPQYGGYCAWAVAQNYKAPIDPTAWQIVDDKLYLNFDARIQRRWERDIPGFIARADANWPGLAD